MGKHDTMFSFFLAVITIVMLYLRNKDIMNFEYYQIVLVGIIGAVFGLFGIKENKSKAILMFVLNLAVIAFLLWQKATYCGSICVIG